MYCEHRMDNFPLYRACIPSQPARKSIFLQFNLHKTCHYLIIYPPSQPLWCRPSTCCNTTTTQQKNMYESPWRRVAIPHDLALPRAGSIYSSCLSPPDIVKYRKGSSQSSHNTQPFTTAGLNMYTGNRSCRYQPPHYLYRD